MISVLLIEVHFTLWDTLAKGVWAVALWCQRYATRRLIDATAHALGCPVVMWLMDLTFTLFF